MGLVRAWRFFLFLFFPCVTKAFHVQRDCYTGLRKSGLWPLFFGLGVTKMDQIWIWWRTRPLILGFYLSSRCRFRELLVLIAYRREWTYRLGRPGSRWSVDEVSCFSNLTSEENGSPSGQVACGDVPEAPSWLCFYQDWCSTSRFAELLFYDGWGFLLFPCCVFFVVSSSLHRRSRTVISITTASSASVRYESSAYCKLTLGELSLTFRWVL